MDHGTWRRLGDSVAALYAAGMHCEGGYTEREVTEPLFLRESRRRVYSAVYRIDKTLAIFFGRPPMIGWRYSDRKQLLDVSDDVIFSEDPDVINKALSRLDGNGWNTDGHIHPSTCIRLRCQHAVFKERLLEQSLSGEKDSDVAHNLRYCFVQPTLRLADPSQDNISGMYSILGGSPGSPALRNVR